MSGHASGKALARNAVFSVIYRLLNILFPLISYGYVARILTSEGVGRHAAAANNVSYFVILGSLGIQAYATREIARKKGDPEGRAKLFSEMLIVNAILTTAAIIAFLVCLFFVPVFREEQLLYLICAIAVATNFINVDWYFQGTEDFRFIAVRSFAVKAVSLAAVFLFVRTAGDLYKYALICVLANGGNHVLNIICAGKSNRFRIRGTSLRTHIRPLLFLALCTVSTELYARMDITMLDILDGKSTVAFYSCAQKIVNLIVVTVIAITAVFLPRLSYYFEKDRPRFHALTKFGAEMMVFLSIPICLGLGSVAQPLISVWLGDGYGEAVSCLMILAFMIPLKCIGDIVCYQVMMCAGREFYLMISYMITLAVNFVCNLILIPRYGAFGASTASLISEIVVFVIVFVASRKYQDYTFNSRNFIVVLLASVVMCGAVFGVGFLSHGKDWIWLIGGTVAGAVIFAGLNIALRNSFLSDEILPRLKKPEKDS